MLAPYEPHAVTKPKSMASEIVTGIPRAISRQVAVISQGFRRGVVLGGGREPRGSLSAVGASNGGFRVQRFLGLRRCA